MKEVIQKHIEELFNKLVIFGFVIRRKWEGHIVEFNSTDYVIKIEKYFRELYVTVYSLNDPSSEINLFNLLGYLLQDDNPPESNYFRDEEQLEECYRKQIMHISRSIQENVQLINDFFKKEKYEVNQNNFENYWKNKHPELYKTCE